jgi:drug/metabolite transporter (DMT)-like permease
MTSPMNGSLIMALNPMLTVLLSAILLKERISARQVLGLSLSLFGVLIVVSNGSLGNLLKLGVSNGDLVIFAGNICWALYAVIGKRFLRQSPPLQTTTFSMLSGSLLLIALAFVRGDAPSLVAQPTGVIAAIAFMAFAGSILAYLWWNNAIAEIGAARTAVFFDLVPITTMLISISFGARVGLMQLIGSLFVLVGVAFSSGVRVKSPLAVPKQKGVAA